MMELNLPKIAVQIDSVHSVNPDNFHVLVINREEENKFLNSIDRKRQKIKKLNLTK